MEGKKNAILFLLVILSVAYGHPARARDVRMIVSPALNIIEEKKICLLFSF